MKGLLKKEKYLFLQNCYAYILAIGLWLVLGSISWIRSKETPSFVFFGYCYLFMGVIRMSFTQMDNMSKWDRTVHTLPIKRSDIVSISYIISMQLVLTVAVANALISGIIYLSSVYVTLTECLCMLLKGIGIGLLPAALYFPIMIVFMNKAGNKPVISIAVSFSCCMVLIGTVFFEDVILKPDPLIFAAIYFAVCVTLFIGSWILSLKLMKDKDIY